MKVIVFDQWDRLVAKFKGIAATAMDERQQYAIVRVEVILSREQQAEIAKLRKAQSETRRQLKNVRKELTADIDALGLRLKIVNIVLVPVLIALLGLFRGLRRRG